MKKILIVMSLLALVALPPVRAAEQKQGQKQAQKQGDKQGQKKSKADSAKFLQKLVKDKIKDAGKEQIEDAAMRAAPGVTKLYKKLAAVISNSELAASICADLIDLGIQNYKEKFATEFATRLKKYIPELYTTGAELLNPMLEKWFGGHIPDEKECYAVLRELGKNTWDAISKMSESEKLQAGEAGVDVRNSAALSIQLNQKNRFENYMKYNSAIPTDDHGRPMIAK